jgi:hypothetical protein
MLGQMSGYRSASHAGTDDENVCCRMRHRRFKSESHRIAKFAASRDDILQVRQIGNYLVYLL